MIEQVQAGMARGFCENYERVSIQAAPAIKVGDMVAVKVIGRRDKELLALKEENK